MHFIAGQNPNEIGDFDVVEQDGRLHCFYLSLPSHDTIGHLVSEDGVRWESMPAAIRTGDPGDFDGDQIWTMGVFRKESTWFMLYTALSQCGLMQAVGLATSPDLVRWTKARHNPVIRADPRWYEAVQKGRYRVDWRDPHVVVRDGVCHGFICARRNKGLLNRRGCAGYFTSTDGYRWQVRPPVSTPSDCFDWECPSVFELDGRFYMTAIAGGCRRQVYRVADRIDGPYRCPPGDDTLLPGENTNMSARPCRWRGRMHLFHWQRGAKDWGSPATYAMLASPKIVEPTADGGLTVRSFDWSSQHAGRPRALGAQTAARISGGAWRWNGGVVRADASDGPALWLARREETDFILSADVALDRKNPARVFGLVFRADADGDQGLFASLVPGRLSVELVKYVYNRRQGPDSLWRGRSVEQAAPFAPPLSGRYRLNVIAFGPSIEFNVNGRLLLARMNLPRRRGRVGLFAEEGRASFSNVSVQPLHAPACHWDW